MSEIAILERVLWGLSFCLNFALVFLLLYRKNYRIYPCFLLYTMVNLFQAVVLFASLQLWKYHSAALFKIAWGSQGLVITARALSVAEVCRQVLAKYRGIWGLGWRLSLAVAGLVLAYSWAVGAHSQLLFLLTADRSIELAIAAALLALLLFAHYYQVAIEPADRFLASGFFLYSCFQVLNDTILERWLQQYADFWNLLGTVTFLASMLLWGWALRVVQQPASSPPELLPGDHYRLLSPAINTRLKALDEQLGRFWRAEGRKNLSLVSYFFFAIIALLFVLFFWSLRNPKRRALPVASSAIPQDPPGSHVTHLPQIRRALAAADFEFASKRIPPKALRRMQRERRNVALAYLSALRAELERLTRTARILASLSPEVAGGQELERLVLTLNFVCRYWVIRTGVWAGFTPLPQISDLGDLLSAYSVRLEEAITALGERAAMVAEMVSSPDRRRIDPV